MIVTIKSLGEIEPTMSIYISDFTNDINKYVEGLVKGFACGRRVNLKDVKVEIQFEED